MPVLVPRFNRSLYDSSGSRVGKCHYNCVRIVGIMESYTPATRIIAAFLRKDVGALVERLNEVLLRETPHFEAQIELDEWALTIATARAVALALEFALTGRSACIS